MFMSKLSQKVKMDFRYPVVNTKYGKIRGIEKEGAFIFRGIKYANAKRFQMPMEVSPWDGIKDAITYGCVSPELVTPVPKDQQLCPHYYLPQDEDCQFLNIWTQSIDNKAKKPVMVWMHGGGWYGGSGVEQYAYDGENLSSHGDVVVVSLNHRLNCLGFMDLSAYGDEYKNSNYAGLADLVFALCWVKDNIAEFGGDPENVTIFGQSGGGGKALYLMQTPKADGLFNRVIVQSGGAKFFGDNGQPAKKMSLRMSKYVIETLGFGKNDISKIEKIPYWQLAEAVKIAQERLESEFDSRFRWEPVPDMKYFYGNPHAFDFRRETLGIPLIMGGTFGEGSSNSRNKIGDGDKNRWEEKKVMEYILEKYGEKGYLIAKEFKKAYPDKKTADVLFIDRFDRYRMSELIKKRTESGGMVWNYIFTLESPINSGTVAWHCSDIPFFFFNSNYIEAAFIPGVSEPLQKLMAGAWISFAKTGNPNFEGLPFWPAAEPDKLPTMLFDEKTCIQTDHDKSLLEALPRITNY